MLALEGDSLGLATKYRLKHKNLGSSHFLILVDTLFPLKILLLAILSYIDDTFGDANINKTLAFILSNVLNLTSTVL